MNEAALVVGNVKKKNFYGVLIDCSTATCHMLMFVYLCITDNKVEL
jgi:hypothetical protein